MATVVTVYRVQPEHVDRVVRRLRSRNLDPTVVDDPGAMTLYRGQSHDVRIAVPVAQKDLALDVLTEIEKGDETRLAPHIKVANGVVLLLIVILGLVAIVAFFDRSAMLLTALWVLIVTAVAVTLFRHAWGKTPKT
jgi:hypothetical protein